MSRTRTEALGIVVVLACAVVTSGCAGRVADPIAPVRAVRVAPPDDDDDLREVIMRELIVTFGAMEWSRVAGESAVRVDVLCLGFGEAVDPSEAFMARLGDEHRVVQASRCRYDDEGGVVRALPSGLPAMFLSVEDVRRDGARAEAKGSYFHDGKAAKEDRFVLERRGDRWVVTSRTMISIS
jgi:hypothetical protein